MCLLLQVALPCALFADASSQLCLKGGTNAEMAPQIDYTIKVSVHTLRYTHHGIHIAVCTIYTLQYPVQTLYSHCAHSEYTQCVP